MAPASESSTPDMRGSFSKGELGAEGEADIEGAVKEEAERPSASAGHSDADCVDEDRPAKAEGFTQ